MKLVYFNKIIPYTKRCSCQCDQPFDNLLLWIEQYEKEYGLQLNPDFQRGHVWNDNQRSRYIEHILRGGLSGRDLYFNNPGLQGRTPKTSYNDFVCVDGLQRITAVKYFMENRIKVFGSFYNEYLDKLPFMDACLKVHINNLQTKTEVLNWYIEMNSSGTPHTEEDLNKVRRILECETNEKI